jgi:hypothetical protein
MLELASRFPDLKHFVCVVVALCRHRKRPPFSVERPVGHPLSLYAAAKLADELGRNPIKLLSGESLSDSVLARSTEDAEQLVLA